MTSFNPSVSVTSDPPAYSSRPPSPPHTGYRETPQIEVRRSSTTTNTPNSQPLSEDQEFSRRLLAIKIGKVALYTTGMFVGAAVTLAGAGLGMAVITHFYLYTEIGLSIFKLFAGIFFLSAATIAAITTVYLTYGPSAHAVRTPGPVLTVYSLIAPFAPILLGGYIGGYPGVEMTKFFYQKAHNVIWPQDPANLPPPLIED